MSAGPRSAPRSGPAPRRSGSGATRTAARGSGTRSGGSRASGSRAATPARSGRSSAARTPARTPRRRAPRRWLGVPLRAWAVLVVLGAVVLAGVAYLTPVLGVRTVTVSGAVATDADAVRAALAVGRGTPLLQVDLDAAARRVSRIPTVGSVEVRRELPSTLEVVVTERRATLAVAEPDGTHLLDAQGVDFAVGAPVPGVPALTTPTPGSGDPATRAALAVLAALPPSLGGQLAEVRAPAADAVSVVLLDGRSVVFGSADDAARKAAVAVAVLTQPGQVVDVTSPDLPTTR